MRRSSPIACLLLVACVEQSSLPFPEPPEDAEAVYLAILSRPEDSLAAKTELWVFSITPSPELALAFGRVEDSDTQFFLFFSATPPAELGLPEGEIIPVEDELPSQPLPRPLDVTFDATPARAEWRPVAGLPPEISELRLPARSITECTSSAEGGVSGCYLPDRGELVCHRPCPAPSDIAPPEGVPASRESLSPTIARPNLAGACPRGWSVETAIEFDLEACTPPSSPFETCPLGSYRPFGQPSCAPIGRSCPVGDWADELTNRSDVLFVREGATNGDGSSTSPFGTIAEAMAAAVEGQTIALSKDNYVLPSSVVRSLTLEGACPERTTLNGSFAIDGIALRLQNVRLAGSAPLITLRSGASLTLHETRADTNPSGPIAEVLDGSTLIIESSHVFGSFVSVDHSHLELRDSGLEATIASESSSVSISNTRIEPTADSNAVFLTGSSHADIDNLASRQTISVGSGSVLIGRGLYIEAVDRPGLVVPGGSIQLSDLWLSGTGEPVLAIFGGGTAALERAQIIGEAPLLITVDGAAKATLLDGRIRSTDGTAVSVAKGSELRLERAEILAAEQGLFVSTSTAQSVLRTIDVTVTLEGDGTGLRTRGEGPVRAELTRTSLIGSHFGIVAAGSSHIVADGLELTGWERGLYLLESSTLDAENLVLTSIGDYGIELEGESDAQIRDVWFENIGAPDRNQLCEGAAIRVNQQARLQLEHVRFNRIFGVAVFAGVERRDGERPVVTSTIHDIIATHTKGGAIRAWKGVELVGARWQLEDSYGRGIEANDPGSMIDAQDVTIWGTHGLDPDGVCVLNRPDQPRAGIPAAVITEDGATTRLERFAVLNAQSGLDYAVRWGDSMVQFGTKTENVHLVDGLIADHPIGFLLTSESSDIREALERVRLERVGSLE